MANEKRLIDANAVVAEIKETVCKNCNSNNGIRCDYCWADDVIGFLQDTPTVDAVEVVHGWWMPQYDRCWIDGQRWKTGYHCSSCMGFSKVESQYCRSCGAKMDGGNEDG